MRNYLKRRGHRDRPCRLGFLDSLSTAAASMPLCRLWRRRPAARRLCQIYDYQLIEVPTLWTCVKQSRKPQSEAQSLSGMGSINLPMSIFFTSIFVLLWASEAASNVRVRQSSCWHLAGRQWVDPVLGYRSYSRSPVLTLVRIKIDNKSVQLPILSLHELWDQE